MIITSATRLLTHSQTPCDLVQLSPLKRSPWLNLSIKYSAVTNKKVNLLNKLYIKRTNVNQKEYQFKKDKYSINNPFSSVLFSTTEINTC